MKNKDRAMEETGLKISQLIESALDAFIAMDAQGAVIEWNPQAESTFGWSRREAMGKYLKDLIIPPEYRDAHEQGIRRYLSTGESRILNKRIEIQALNKQGTLFPVELSVIPYCINDRHFFTAFIRDISKQKSAAKERDYLIEKLRQSNEELERFAYIASHDLKAPLRAIDNLSGWLEEELQDKLEDETKEYMDTLRQRVHRMEKLLNDLLEYSRVGRKLDDSYEETLSGMELLEDVLTLISPPESFSIDISPKFADIGVRRMPLQQIFFNLISNAIKHHDKGKGIVKIGLEEKNGHFLFSVKDDGPGIPEEFQEKIFEMFQTLKARDEVEGSGIGLAIVKKAIQLHGGELFLDSKPGKGSTFSFTWPKNAKVR